MGRKGGEGWCPKGDPNSEKVGPRRVGPRRVGGPEGWLPRRVGPRKGGAHRLWPKPTLAKTDFGQTDFGQNRLWPNLICCVVCCVVLYCVVCCLSGVLFHFMCGCWFQGLVWTALPLGRPSPGPPFPGPPFPGPPKISRFFFPLPPQNSFFSSLSGGLLVEFWWCLKRRGPEMCTFGVLGLSCASPGGQVWWGRRGFTRQPESPKKWFLMRVVFDEIGF